VQAHNEPNIKNTQHPRTIAFIFLRYVDNDQGGHHLLDLRTGCTLTRRTVTMIPITQNIIDLVLDMANNDKMPDGIKIESKSGTTIYDSSWIAGVDYEYDNNDIDNNDEYDDNDNNDEYDDIDNNDEYDDVDPNDLAEILFYWDDFTIEKTNKQTNLLFLINK
jgi:hypothetical protein